MTKIGPSRREKSHAEKDPEVRTASEPEERIEPRVKRAAEDLPAPSPEPPAPEVPKRVPPATVILVEGQSYVLRGVRFQLHRPVTVTDERLLAALRTNARFEVRGGGDR